MGRTHGAVALEEHTFVDDQPLGLDVPFHVGPALQFDLVVGDDISDQLAADDGVLHRDLAVHRAGFADDEAFRGADVALEFAFDAQGAANFDLAFEFAALGDDRGLTAGYGLVIGFFSEHRVPPWPGRRPAGYFFDFPGNEPGCFLLELVLRRVPRHDGAGINRLALLPNLEMQMWTGRLAAFTHVGDDLARFDPITLADRNPAQVAINC